MATYTLIDSFGSIVEAYGRMRKTLAEELDESVGMPLSWFEVLLRISRSGGQMKMADISNQVVITTGGITKLIDRLIEQGYIKRQPCQEDRRIVWACITDKGTKAFKEALASHNASLRKHMSGLTETEIETVSKIMNKLK
jgi:DNA-binding MarR family transcriptional regulator